MSVLYKDVLLRGKKGTIPVKALFDSGASISFVRKDIAEKVNDISDLGEIENLIMGDDTRATANKKVIAGFIIDDCVLVSNFKVLDKMSEEVIVGADMLQEKNIILDFEHDKIDTSKCRMYSKL